MKVTKVETLRADRYNWVKVHTDEGIHGTGETHPASGTAGWPKAVLGGVEYCADYLVGKNPLEIEKHWQHMFRRQLFRGGSDLMSAMSAIDQALWDIASKAAGLPVYRMLGGPVRDRVKVYVHLRGQTPEEMADDARKRIAEGYKALRFYPFASLEGGMPESYQAMVRMAVSFMKAVREAAGPDMDIMIDVVNRLTPPEAIAIGRALAEYGLYFFEDPIEPDNIDAMADVARAMPVPVATGERLYTIYQFQELLKKKAAAYIRPDPSLAGGISQIKKIAGLAEAEYVGVVPHNPLSPVSTAVCAQLCACIHNIAVQEYTGTEWQKPKRDFVVEPLKIKDGFLEIPDRPGLGIELNEEALKHYPPRPIERPIAYNLDGSLRDY
ncbi:MAG: galactonate dehydratase [Chloroflexi bacterium]|nr:galactonate dehydratase [Chloroflexota bacterium]